MNKNEIVDRVGADNWDEVAEAFSRQSYDQILSELNYMYADEENEELAGAIHAHLESFFLMKTFAIRLPSGTTEEHANTNMMNFIGDSGVNANFVRIPEYDCEDGRYTYLVWRGTECHEIQMPGLSLEQVRYVGGESQNLWDFPRLYVDGSSWLWEYAVADLFEEDADD